MPRTVNFEGTEHRFPDDATDEEIGKALDTMHPAKPDAAKSMLQQVGHAAYEASGLGVMEGVGSGVAKTGLGAYKLARMIPGADKMLPAPNAFAEDVASAPDSITGKIGHYGEQALEFLLPMSKIGKAVEAAPLAAKLGAKALTAGLISGVQSGGDPTSMALSAGTEGILGGAGAAIPAVGKSVLRKIIDNAPRPLSEGATKIAERYGVPLTQGMKGGSKTTQAVEGMLGRSVASDVYEPLMQDGQAGVNQGAYELSHGFQVDKFTAGDNTAKTMLNRADDLTTQAQQEYNALAAHEANPANVRSVQVGTKTVPAGAPSSLLDANGRPVGGTPASTAPVMEDIGLPVDMRPTQKALAPIVDDISRRMSGAQRNSDPGLAAIKNILTRPPQIAASVAEKDLGYLKSIMRSDASGEAKRLAGVAIESLQKQVDDAVSVAGPDALASLKTARAAWKSREDILTTVKELSGTTSGEKGQVLLTNKLLQPSDGSFPALQKVLAVAPDAADDLGKAYLTEKVFKKVASGDNLNPTQASNLWNQIGPRTKAALYGKEQIADIDHFFEMAKRVAENPNPSGTGIVNTLLKAGILITHPVAGVSGFAFGRNVAKVLYNREGASALRTALNAPGTAAGSRAMAIVRALVDKSAEGNAALVGSPQAPQIGAP